MDEIAEMEERLELALELETLFNHAYESSGGIGFTDHEFWRQSSEIADSLWRRDYGWIEHSLRFIGGEEALVLSQRLKSYQKEREEKPKSGRKENINRRKGRWPDEKTKPCSACPSECERTSPSGRAGRKEWTEQGGIFTFPDLRRTASDKAL